MNHVMMLNEIMKGNYDEVRKKLKSKSVDKRLKVIHDGLQYFGVKPEVSNFIKNHFGDEVKAVVAGFTTPEMKAAVREAYEVSEAEFRKLAAERKASKD